MRRVVILGGGHAGVRCAEELVRRRKPDDQLINALYLGVLSRYPNAAEMKTAQAVITAAGSQAAGGTSLLWALYNKVDFVFNY